MPVILIQVSEWLNDSIKVLGQHRGYRETIYIYINSKRYRKITITDTVNNTPNNTHNNTPNDRANTP